MSPRRNPAERRCTYVVPLEKSASIEDVRALAGYLSTLTVEGFSVLVADEASDENFEANRNILRWVASHLPIDAQHLTASGAIDPVRAAVELATDEKLVVARPDVRYGPGELSTVCGLLDVHEVVEPQDYFSPLNWWGAIDAARMLIHRALGPYPDHGGTFAFRRSAISSLHGIDGGFGDDHVRRLALGGAEVFSAFDVFVRRSGTPFREWLRERTRQAEDDFALPVKSAFFFALVPLILALVIAVGGRMAAGYAGAIGFAAVALAARGRSGARAFFPLHVCLFAPLWLLERSISVYCAIGLRLRSATQAPARTAVSSHRTARRASGR